METEEASAQQRGDRKEDERRMVNSHPMMSPPLLGAKEVISSFHCVYNNQSATCFLHGDPGKTYFVTAKHAVKGAQVGDNVLFRKADDSYWKMPILSIMHSTEYDVTVFSSSGLKFRRSFGLNEPAQVLPGQRIAFVGFPHGLATNYPNENGFASPPVTGAGFSGIVKINGYEVLVLDGFNNPGYSGAPVWANNQNGQPAVLGVVVEYRFERESHSKIYTKKNGVEEEVPSLYTKPNSGMIYAVPMHHVQSLARQLAIVNEVLPQD